MPEISLSDGSAMAATAAKAAGRAAATSGSGAATGVSSDASSASEIQSKCCTALLELRETTTLSSKWRDALDAFREACDVQPTPCFSEVFGFERKSLLLTLLNLKLYDQQASDWDVQTRAAALHALRVLSREQAADELFRTDEFLVCVAREAGIGADGLPRAHWDSSSEQAAILLANMLIIRGQDSAEILRTSMSARHAQLEPTSCLRTHAEVICQISTCVNLCPCALECLSTSTLAHVCT
eukprot:2697839-Pleurochrysis_carterae.AAC.4